MTPLLLVVLAACGSGFADPSRELAPPVPDGPRHAVEVALPTGLGVVDGPETDVLGAPVGVGCDTCHGPEPAESWAARPGEPFHEGVEIAHGELSCDACHDPADRRLLRLADGTRLAFPDAMRLCGQCHGPQRRDYGHGAHGGMAGYWDTRRGPQERAHCVACHRPHAPAIGRFLPVLSPRDRGLGETTHAD
jgi:hypothetical protein